MQVERYPAIPTGVERVDLSIPGFQGRVQAGPWLGSSLVQWVFWGPQNGREGLKTTASGFELKPRSDLFALTRHSEAWGSNIGHYHCISPPTNKCDMKNKTISLIQVIIHLLQELSARWLGQIN